jgi:hypothetical protein
MVDPWWTIEAAKWGFEEERDIHCRECAESKGHALGRELTNLEINQLGGVTCQGCGYGWPAVHMADVRCRCATCAALSTSEREQR